MTAAISTFWGLVEKELEKLPVEGPLPRDDVETWAWWNGRMVNVLEAADITYRGTSIRYNEWSTMMVVKVSMGDAPWVVFVTERDTTGCMRLFRRLLQEDRVKWKADQFA